LAERGRTLEGAAGNAETRLAAMQELEQALAAERDALDVRQATLTEAVAELEAKIRELTAAQAAVTERERRVAEAEERERETTRREAELVAREQRLREQAEEIERRRTELPPEAPPETAHLLLVPGERYELHEADGAPPAAGAEITLGETGYRVVRIGPSPYPGDARRCAFLELAAG
ncbi:MAG TPA: hypothetical protein VJ689_02605, partial [Gaiellaceae bacterium]|nr:hypothetical protein [Gaiellaceae bacterium]